MGAPISTKFGSLMQNNTPITAKWPRSKPEVKFQYGGRFFFVFQTRKCGETRMVRLPDCEKTLRICVIVWQNTGVWQTDRQTDEHTDRHLATA